MSWNPRYAAFAEAHGNTPEEQLRKDEVAWPGGKMCGFILWINERLGEAYAAHRDWFLDKWTLTDQEAFTRFCQDAGQNRIQLTR